MEINREGLIAGKLAADKRIAEAKQLFLAALEEKQKLITGIRPPIPHLKQNFDTLLATFAEQRGNPLYYPFIGSGIGRGPLVELMDGSIKYDFISGIGVHHWGHSHPEIVSAALDAAMSDTIMQGNLQQNWDTVEISELLIRASGLDHCFLASSGAMANENALKILFQKKFPASRVLSFEHCFTGRTLGLSQITDKPAYRDGLPPTLMVDYIPFFDEKQPIESTQRAIQTLKEHLARYPKQHALMIFELVQGEGGFYSAPREFFVAVMDILREHHVGIFIDEVQTFGRTSRLFAFQHFQLEAYADVVSIGKLSQVCATLFKKEFQPRLGLLSQTFTSSTAAIQAAKVIIQHLIEGGYFGPDGKIVHIHHHFTQKLHSLAIRYPHLIAGPFGVGAMIAFTPLGGEGSRVVKFAKDLFEAGLICFIAGSNPTRIRFLLPVGAVSPADIDEVTHLIETTLLKNHEQ